MPPPVEFEAPDRPLRGPEPPKDQLFFCSQGSELWVRGASYKACASPSGFSYVPFLGSEAPQNYPVHFRLESATLGGRALVLSDSASVAREADRLVLDRGAVEVRYDLAPHEVEQSFAVNAAGATGDLVLTLSVESDLTPEENGDAFRFHGPHGGMNYGAATVLDAAGRSAPVRSALQNGQLQLTVPASFLAEASGQVIVDPILNSYAIDSATSYQGNVDVAYDLTTDTFLWAFEDKFSGTDLDVYAVVRNAIDGTVVAGRYVDLSDSYWSDVSVANLNGSDVSIVVAERRNLARPTAPREIVGRIFSYASQTFAPTILIGDVTPTWANRGSDVGGNGSTATDGSFAVVWRRKFSSGWDGRMRLVGADGTLGPLTALTQNPNDDTTAVSISKSTGDPGSTNVWTVAIAERLGSGRAEEVRTAQYNPMGQSLSAFQPMLQYQTGLSGRLRAAIDVSDTIMIDGNPTYAVAVDELSLPIAATTVVLASGSQVLNTFPIHESEHADRLKVRRESRLATTRDEFLISYRETAGLGTQGYVTAFDVTEVRYLAISERRARLGFALETREGSGVEMASRFSGGNTSSRYVGIGWDTGGGAASDVVGVTHFASNPLSPAFQYCYGYPNSTGQRGFIRLEGNRSATSSKTMVATGLPPGETGVFIVGSGFADEFRPGDSNGVLCVGGSIGNYPGTGMVSVAADGTARLAFDPTAIEQPGGAVTGLAGQFWQFQFWHTDSGAANPTSNFTNAVTILLD